MSYFRFLPARRRKKPLAQKGEEKTEDETFESATREILKLS